MKTRWLGLADALGIEETAAHEIWLQLTTAYGADGRFYHNLNHIQHALEIADKLQDMATDFTAVQLALWFHDVVYDPHQTDNEAQSAAYAQRVLRPLGVSERILNRASGLILATKSHQTTTDDRNTFVMLDADLAILGAPPAQYDAYARAIRQEYSFVPDAAYRQGRTAVLQRFLARSPFYFTEWMRVRFDTAVTQNLTRELERIATEDTER